MSPDEKEVRKILDQSPISYRDLSQEDIELAVNRVWENLASGVVVTSERAQRSADSLPARPALTQRRSHWLAVAAAVAAIVMAAILPTRILQGAPAVLEDAEGKRGIQYGELVRPVGDMSAMLSIKDGPRVETRSMSEFSLEHTDDGGTRIRLKEGGLIVDASSESRANLYVETKDMTALVSGAVSLVKAEAEGSRIAAIGGEIRVQQGTTEKKLRPGEQVATSPAMELVPVKQEVAWSRHAESHAALFEQAVTEATFELASIKPSPVSVPLPQNQGQGGMGGGGGGAMTNAEFCLGISPQIDPRRFTVRSATVYELIDGAYGISDCRPEVGFISGGPDWTRSQRFEIQALIPEGSQSYTSSEFRHGNAPGLQRMLQNLLEQRFKLSLRRETKEMRVYNVVVANPGKMKASQDQTPVPDPTPDARRAARGTPLRGDLMIWPFRGLLEGTSISMPQLLQQLQPRLNRPLVDRTGLIGLFDIHVQVETGQQPIDSVTQVLNGLGLKLESATSTVEVLVIQHVEQPSEN